MTAALKEQQDRRSAPAKGGRKARSTVAARKTPSAINLRIDVETYALIEQARAYAGLNRTDFMLTSARARAQDLLLEQAYIRVPESAWDAFTAALDAPPAPNDELRRLMASKSPWDKE